MAATSVPVGIKRGPSLRLALVLLCLGVLIAVPSAVLIGVRAVGTINSPSVATPGIVQRQLGTGRWFVYQRTGTRSGGGGFTFSQNQAPDLEPSQVKVTAPDATTLAVSFVTVNDTLTKGTSIYTAVVQFDAPASGRYTIEVDTTTPGSVVITRSLGGTFRSIVVPLLAGVVGGLLVLTGLILLVVGSARRSRAARPAGPPRGAWAAGPSGGAWSPVASGGAWSPTPTPSGPTPPGWYPDPQPGAPGRQRWWDGNQWTEHQN